MKRIGFDRALALTLLVLALLVTFALPMLAPPEDDVADSVGSREPDGRLALVLVLERAGLEPETWRAAPARLPAGPHVVWAARAPRPFGAHFRSPRGRARDAERGDVEEQRDGEPPEGSDEEPEPDDAREEAHEVLARRLGPDALALHDLAHYLRFVEGGGTLVLPAGERTQAFLTAVDLDRLAPLARAGDADRDERIEGAVSFAGDDERIDVDWPAAGVLAPEALADAGVEALAVLDGAGPVAWSAPVGAGRIVVLGDDGFARNGDVDRLGVGTAQGIGRRRHGLLAVRLVERLAGGAEGRLLFDETAIGRWRPETALELATSGPRGLLLLHAALFVLVLVWRTTWVREFPRDPEPLERVSPLARARAQASLYARARRFDLLAGALRHGVLDGIARRLGRRPPRATAAVEHEGVASVERAEVERVLAAAGDALGAADRARFEAAFLGLPPASEAGLAALAAALAELERSVAPHAPSRPASGIVPARGPRPRATATERDRSER